MWCYLYSGINNVIVDMPIWFKSACTLGDCSYNVRDRVCIRLVSLRFLPCAIVRDRRFFRFVTFLRNAGMFSKTTTSRFFKYGIIVWNNVTNWPVSRTIKSFVMETDYKNINSYVNEFITHSS